jgi:hypothetical protein
LVSQVRLRHSLAVCYRRGRAFLAGDAAHVHGAAGGRGIDTGLEDAVNLGWKLHLVLAGRAPDEFLDSYEHERRAFALSLLHVTDRLFSLLASPSPFISGLRNLALSSIGLRMIANSTSRARLLRFLLPLGLGYAESPVVDEDRASADHEFRSGPGKGARAPDGPVLLRGGALSSLFSCVAGKTHHLLLFGGPDSDSLVPLIEAEKRLPRGYRELFRTHFVVGRDPLDAGETPSVYLDSCGLLHRRYGMRRSGLYFLRPDGYVAYRCPRLDVNGFVAYLAEVFARRLVSPLPMRAREAQ